MRNLIRQQQMKNFVLENTRYFYTTLHTFPFYYNFCHKVRGKFGMMKCLGTKVLYFLWCYIGYLNGDYCLYSNLHELKISFPDSRLNNFDRVLFHNRTFRKDIYWSYPFRWQADERYYLIRQYKDYHLLQLFLMDREQSFFPFHS